MVAFRVLPALGAAALIAATNSPVEAAGTIEGGGRQALNVPAIGMFFVFVAATLGITYWAAQRTRSAADFYAAGGNITAIPEWACHRRRLYVGGIILGHFWFGLCDRL